LFPFLNRGLKAFRGGLTPLMVVLLVISACARIPVSVKEAALPPLEAERLQKAEELSQRQAYQEALTIYQDHLERFPRGPHGDTILMKIGTIQMNLGSYTLSRQAFYRLLDEHPESSLAADARFSIILTYYQEEKYAEAVKYAGLALRYAPTTPQKIRIYNLMGHGYSAAGQCQEAVGSYMKAYQLAPERERSDILGNVKALIPSLTESELNSLIKQYGEGALGGDLRLQLAKVYASEDRNDEALHALSEFVRLFPDHEELESAETLRETIQSRALVDRFSIGCILPLSGAYETFGRRALTGIELALSEFNTPGHGSPVELLIRDSKGDFSEAVLAVESLALQDNVIGIIGPMITSESAAFRAQALEVPIITLTQKSDMTKVGDYVFRNFLTASLQVKAVVGYAVEDLGIRKFAVLYPDEPYGISFMNEFWDRLIMHGGEIVGIESYEPEQMDFAEPIKKLVGLFYPRVEEPPGEETTEEAADGLTENPTEPPDEIAPRKHQSPDGGEDKELKPIVDFGAVFIPDSYEKVALIAPQLPFYDVNNVLLLGTNLWHSDKLIETARNYVQGAIVPDGFFADSDTPRVQDFVKRFIEIFGVSPGFIEAQAYDTARILFELVNRPDVRSRIGLKRALLNLRDFPGVTGLTAFDENGDADKQIYLLKIRGSRFVQIEP